MKYKITLKILEGPAKCKIRMIYYCWITGLLDYWITGLLDYWITGLLFVLKTQI